MKKYFLIILLALCLQSQAYADSQPVLDQINKTQTIRCGYVVWPPAFSIDANTKIKSGIFYDIAEEMAKRLNLQIEWTEELGWATMIEAVKTNRVDMMCSATFANSARARHVDFSTPAFYSLMYAWKSSKSEKTYKDFSDLDKPDVRFAFVDGTIPDKIVHRQFTHSQMVSSPDMTPISDLLEGLTTKKFDTMMIDEATVNDFMKKNPGSITKAIDKPIAFFPDVMLLPAGETKLKAMVDNTINEMLYDGTIIKILAKYNLEQGYKLPAKPYQD